MTVGRVSAPAGGRRSTGMGARDEPALCEARRSAAGRSAKPVDFVAAADEGPSRHRPFRPGAPSTGPIEGPRSPVRLPRWCPLARPPGWRRPREPGFRARAERPRSPGRHGRRSGRATGCDAWAMPFPLHAVTRRVPSCLPDRVVPMGSAAGRAPVRDAEREDPGPGHRFLDDATGAVGKLDVVDPAPVLRADIHWSLIRP